MSTREVLGDGSVQLVSGRCTFVYTRLRRGALLIRVTGNDAGEDLMGPLDEVSAEIARFGPLELFIDLSAVTGVAPSVTEAWAAWFRANRQSILRVSVLTASKLIYVAASTVKLLSRTDEMIRVYTDADLFEHGLGRSAPPARPAAPALPATPAPRPPSSRSGAAEAPPSAPKREVLPDGTVRLTGATCSFLYRRPRPGLFLVTVRGNDRGELGTAPIDEISAEIARFGPLDLFVDTAAATGVDTTVSELWTAWFRDNQPRLKRVSILATTRFVHLVVSIAKLLSRTGELIRIYDEVGPFEQAIAREVPGFTLPPAS